MGSDHLITWACHQKAQLRYQNVRHWNVHIFTETTITKLSYYQKEYNSSSQSINI